MKLKVWMSAPEAPDLDVFVAVQKLDAYGDLIGLVIQGRDVYRYPRPLIQAWHDDSVNRGPHVIHAGGEYDSHLLVPTLLADDHALLGCVRERHLVRSRPLQPGPFPASSRIPRPR
jgi:hypothetical protein